MPCRWCEQGWQDFTGRARFRRRFGYPGQIDSHEHVWLTIGNVSDHAIISLNGTDLGSHEGAAGSWEQEITALLRPRNELVVEVEGSAPTAGLWGETALEIRRGAFLQDVCLQATPGEGTVQITAHGKVIGQAEGSLELVMVCNRRGAAYTPIEADPAGQPFVLASEPAPFPQEGEESQAMTVKLNLIKGAEIWYTLEQTLTSEQLHPAGK